MLGYSEDKYLKKAEKQNKKLKKGNRPFNYFIYKAAGFYYIGSLLKTIMIPDPNYIL